MNSKFHLKLRYLPNIRNIDKYKLLKLHEILDLVSIKKNSKDGSLDIEVHEIELLLPKIQPSHMFFVFFFSQNYKRFLFTFHGRSRRTIKSVI